MNETIKTQHEAIKAAVNIVEVISEFIQLKRRAGNFLACCPFHNEKTASFSVSPAKGIYKCFGCGASGDAIKFLLEHAKLEYLNAMRWLADFYRLPLDELDTSAPRAYVKPRPRPAAPAPKRTNVPAPSFINRDVFNQSLKKYEENNLVEFLRTLFDKFVVDALIEKYHIGTSKYYPGGCIFWQIDETGNIRTGKIMPYSPETGKRDRMAKPASNWVHSVMKLEPFNLQQCFFGQHLLGDDYSYPVAVVESEKTAIIASVFIPSYIWIATGGKGYEKFNKTGDIMPVPEMLREKFKVLAGRQVELFPDHGAVEDWQHLAGELSDITSIEVNDLLQVVVKEYQLPDKSDICDYLTSEAYRTELVNEFKATVIDVAPQTRSETVAIAKEFCEKGLRCKDLRRARIEILEEYEIDSNGLLVGLKSEMLAF